MHWGPLKLLHTMTMICFKIHAARYCIELGVILEKNLLAIVLSKDRCNKILSLFDSNVNVRSIVRKMALSACLCMHTMKQLGILATMVSRNQFHSAIGSCFLIAFCLKCGPD